MGFFRKLGNAISRPFRRFTPRGRAPTPAPPPPTPYAPSRASRGGPSYGDPFPSSDEGNSLSSRGVEFAFSVSGIKWIRGDREDLEKQPNRTLTDRDLVNADYVVVRFTDTTGKTHYTTVAGPWENWEDLWDDMTVEYDATDDY